MRVGGAPAEGQEPPCSLFLRSLREGGPAAEVFLGEKEEGMCGIGSCLLLEKGRRVGLLFLQGQALGDP